MFDLTIRVLQISRLRLRGDKSWPRSAAVEKTEMPCCSIPCPMLPGDVKEITADRNLSRSMALNSLSSILSAPPAESPDMTCSTVTIRRLSRPVRIAKSSAGEALSALVRSSIESSVDTGTGKTANFNVVITHVLKKSRADLGIIS